MAQNGQRCVGEGGARDGGGHRLGALHQERRDAGTNVCGPFCPPQISMSAL